MNQKVSDLISKAEMEQNDYRRGKKPNVFFGPEKRYFGFKIGVFTFNTIGSDCIHAWIACCAALDFAKATGSARN